MTTLLGERLEEAMKNGLNTFVWKGNKTIDENGRYKQSEKRLIDMSENELKLAYEHCKIMLFNGDAKNPGRYSVLKLIEDQRNKCGAELFLRYIETEKNITRFRLLELINGFLNVNKESLKNIKPNIGLVFSSIPNEFELLPVDNIIDGCLDRLGIFNKKHITRSFILRQGIWLTAAESQDLLENSDPNEKSDRISLIRNRLNLKEIERLYINASGLNYAQMRAMMTLKPNKKYIDFTTLQLETLRNRILFSLEEDVKKHITAWETRMSQIEKVTEHLNFKI
jgi:hypothetical protein